MLLFSEDHNLGPILSGTTSIYGDVWERIAAKKMPQMPIYRVFDGICIGMRLFRDVFWHLHYSSNCLNARAVLHVCISLP